MTILCGTDFTEHANDALQVAASLAKRSGDDLVLLHVSAFLGWQASQHDDEGGRASGKPPTAFAAALAEVRRDLEHRLDAESRKLEESGVSFTAEFLQGTPDEVLVEQAEKHKARLIVIGALGRRSDRLWTLGGTADRVTEKAKVPVLVVRRARAFENWIGGRAPLRVLLGADLSPSCIAAVVALDAFVSSSPCKITGVHVYWPPEQRTKQGSRSAIPLGSGHTEVERQLKTELEQHLSRKPSETAIELQLVGGLGRPADHLVKVAADLESDLIVVGNHQRTGFEKFWHGSVSHGVIDRAATNVLCVPSPR